MSGARSGAPQAPFWHKKGRYVQNDDCASVDCSVDAFLTHQKGRYGATDVFDCYSLDRFSTFGIADLSWRPDQQEASAAAIFQWLCLRRELHSPFQDASRRLI